MQAAIQEEASQGFVQRVVPAHIFGGRQRVEVLVEQCGGMTGRAAATQWLQLLKIAQAHLGFGEPDGRGVRHRLQRLDQFVNQGFAAKTAAGLTDVPPPVQMGGDFALPLRREGHGNHIGVVAFARGQGNDILGRIDQALGQAKTGGVRHVVSGRAHDHRVGFALNANGERLFIDDLQVRGVSVVVFPTNDGILSGAHDPALPGA
jgi:hypothetical protein